MTRRAVFTSILGGYEKLNEQPTALTSPVDFICLTDDPFSRSDTWHMVTVQPLLACDPARSQRDFKIRGHAALAEYTCGDATLIRSILAWRARVQLRDGLRSQWTASAKSDSRPFGSERRFRALAEPHPQQG